MVDSGQRGVFIHLDLGSMLRQASHRVVGIGSHVEKGVINGCMLLGVYWAQMT